MKIQDLIDQSEREEKKKRKIDMQSLSRKIVENIRKEREYKRNLRKINLLRRKEAYRSSNVGKISNFISKGFSFLESPTKTMYSKQKELGKIDKFFNKRYYDKQRIKFGRGRPKGSFDPRYAQFGGVYGYRKWLSQQRWKEKMEVMQDSLMNPRQRQILESIKRSEEERMKSPENRTFPDTNGYFSLDPIFDEIDKYSRLID